MYHLIEFCTPFVADLEISPKHRLERLRIRRGMRLHAWLQLQVVETRQGPVEVADLYLDNGTVIRGIPYRQFRFVEE